MVVGKWQRVRNDSSAITVYNEGLVVYLWDETQRQEIENSDADFQSGYAETDKDIDEGLKQLAKRDLLIAYELFQDDELSVEVIVGQPLTKKELSTARWFKPQLARLKLPGGMLRIDTPNTLPMSNETTDEEPGRVSVPTGDYVLHLYRLDVDALLRDGLLNEGDAWDGPQEILVLTPAADVKPVKTNKPLLRVLTPPSWNGKYQIVDGLFIGQAQARDARHSCLVNMDAAAVASMGIQVGSLLNIEVTGLTIQAVYVGLREPLQVSRHSNYHLAGGRAEFGYAYRLIWDAETEHMLVIDRSVAAADFPAINKRIPVKVTVQAEFLKIPG